jgi:hypothetical protein
MRVTSQIKAALLYLLPTGAILGIWYVLLFQGDSSNSSATDTLAFVLTEGPEPLWFLWLLVLPSCFLALAGSYLTPLARSHAGSRVLLVVGASLAACAWFTLSTEVALLSSLPVLYGFLAAKQASSRRSENAA